MTDNQNKRYPTEGNVFKDKKGIIINMINEEDFNQKWEKYKKLYSITVNPDETRTGISIRMKQSYHKMFSRYAAMNNMTIGEFYEKAAIYYMKTYPHPQINTGDTLDRL